MISWLITKEWTIHTLIIQLSFPLTFKLSYCKCIMAVKDNIKRQCYFLCWLKDKFINFTKWNDFYLKKKLSLFRNRNIVLNKFEPSFMSASLTAYCWQVFFSLLHCCFKFMALQWNFWKIDGFSVNLNDSKIPLKDSIEKVPEIFVKVSILLRLNGRFIRGSTIWNFSRKSPASLARLLHLKIHLFC
jgi:hypothetical protein